MKRAAAVIMLILVLALTNAPCMAEEEQGRQPPADMQKAMEEMGPAMGSMMEQMMTGMFLLLSRPETAERLAAFTKNYYDALIKKGFTKEEAMQIVTHMGVPSLGK